MRELLSLHRVEAETVYCARVQRFPHPWQEPLGGTRQPALGCWGRSLIVWWLEFSSTQRVPMTTLTGQSPQPGHAGPPELSLAHNQVSPRFGANPAASHFPRWEQEGGAHMLFVDVRKLQRPSSLGGWGKDCCEVLGCGTWGRRCMTSNAPSSFSPHHKEHHLLLAL